MPETVIYIFHYPSVGTFLWSIFVLWVTAWTANGIIGYLLKNLLIRNGGICFWQEIVY